MAGQVAYHLLAQAGAARAPWPVTTIVSCLPVLVLAMGTALAHMLRGDTTDAGAPGTSTPGPAVPCPEDQSRPGRSPGHQPDHPASDGHPARPGPAAGTGRSSHQDHHADSQAAGPGPRVTESKTDQARLVSRQLAEHGKPVSRRALRSAGVQGSNEALNALARMINDESRHEGMSPP
jgi:hypothetical protein